MKLYFVKIDLNSIKKNKDAGSCQTLIPGPWDIRFKAKTLPEYMIEGKNCLVTEYDVMNGKRINVKGFIIDPHIIDEFCNDDRCMSIVSERKVHRINHSLIPEYSYMYENIEIECCHCNSTIMTDDLETTCGYVDGLEIYEDRCCPECGESNCCELEYEKINNAIERKKIS